MSWVRQDDGPTGDRLPWAGKEKRRGPTPRRFIYCTHCYLAVSFTPIDALACPALHFLRRKIFRARVTFPAAHRPTAPFRSAPMNFAQLTSVAEEVVTQ